MYLWQFIVGILEPTTVLDLVTLGAVYGTECVTETVFQVVFFQASPVFQKYSLGLILQAGL